MVQEDRKILNTMVSEKICCGVLTTAAADDDAIYYSSVK